LIFRADPSSPYDRVVETQQVLIFRATGRQIGYLAIAVAVLALVAAAILVPHYEAGFGQSSVVFGWGLATAISAPTVGWVLLRYKRAFTECSPAGIRSRGLTREWRCDWAHVRDIAIRRSVNPRGPDTYTMVVTTVGGDRLQLGMPVRGGLMPDREFDAKAEKIRAYWQAAVGAQPTPGVPASVVTGASAPIRRQTVLRMCVELVLVAALITVPFTLRGSGPALLARLGGGQPGSFTASTLTCDTTCYWVGNFTPGHGGPARAGLAMAPGARIGHGGQRIAAVYLGNGQVVYPAGGGPDWIPLALVLLVIVACLVPTIGWIIGWRRRVGRARVRDYSHDVTSQGQPVQAATSNRPGIVLGLAIVASTVAGASLGYAAHLIPVSPARAALACAEYHAWQEAQPNSGSSHVSPALLAGATHEATGTLQVDLATLSGDVAAESGSSGVVGIAAMATVLKDMETVQVACGHVS
jgi:hypothetical protein